MTEQVTGACNVFCALGIGEEVDATDAVEPVGRDEQREPPHELAGRKGHDAISILGIFATIVDPERQAMAVESVDALVGESPVPPRPLGSVETKRSSPWIYAQWFSAASKLDACLVKVRLEGLRRQ